MQKTKDRAPRTPLKTLIIILKRLDLVTLSIISFKDPTKKRE